MWKERSGQARGLSGGGWPGAQGYRYGVRAVLLSPTCLGRLGDRKRPFHSLIYMQEPLGDMACQPPISGGKMSGLVRIIRTGFPHINHFIHSFP